MSVKGSKSFFKGGKHFNLCYLCTMIEIAIREKNNRQVATWLLIGVGMIVIQVLLGGITRLTESGLSITEWKPITGALPPMDDATWQLEFDKYRTTDQFKYVHQDFSMSDFKFIYFWEWFHRQWARFMGVVFLVGFVYFLVRRKLSRPMLLPLVLLFLLGALQGAIGWIMVQSGLVPEKFYVGHIELTTHFIAAMLLLAYTLWFAMSLLPSFNTKLTHTPIRNMLFLIAGIFFIQLIYGGFMAGLRAAETAPTWPSINGKMIPATLTEMKPFAQNLVNNSLTIHFIHRGIAYLLFALVAVFYIRSRNITGNRTFSLLRNGVAVLMVLQVLLGILTLLNATNSLNFVWLGVSHQFTAMLLVMGMTGLLFIVQKVKMVAA